MKIWTCNNFKGHYPVGTAAIVIAETSEDAALILQYEVERIGLIQTILPEQMEEMPPTIGNCVILCDGDY